MNKRISRLVAGLLTVCSLGVSLTSCGFTDSVSAGWDKLKDGFSEIGKEEESDSSSGTLAIDQIDGVSVMSFTTTAPVDGYPTATVTATVLPESLSSEMKKVDWSLSWLDNQTGDAMAEVTDYVTVSTDADGSATCTLTCIQAFAGSKIGLTCTTRVGNKSGVCTVTYVGRPTSLTVTPDDGLTLDPDVVGWGVPCYVGVPGQTYYSTLSLDNELHAVNATRDYVVTSISLRGQFNCRYEISVDGGGSYSQIIQSSASDFAEDLYSVRIYGDQLAVLMKQHPFAFTKTGSLGDAVEKWTSIGVDQGTFPARGAAVLTVEVKDNVSGLTQSICFAVDLSQEPTDVIVPDSGVIG